MEDERFDGKPTKMLLKNSINTKAGGAGGGSPLILDMLAAPRRRGPGGGTPCLEGAPFGDVLN